ncbi:MAG: pyridoxal 5'-phosphate synthase glutaminase subunit PdxT [Bryobacteraceae bacterium]
MKTVGVLALQGDYEAHRKAIEGAGAHAVEVRTAAEMHACDGLILPGGESTTMLKLLDMEQLTQPLRDFAATKPVFGTCAGAILLAQAVSHPVQTSLQLLDIDVERNGYGRQVDSRIVKLQTSEGEIEAVFIRAPIIRRVGDKATVLATYDGDPVWVEQGRHMVTTFHPELSTGSAVHKRFLSKI